MGMRKSMLRAGVVVALATHEGSGFVLTKRRETFSRCVPNIPSVRVYCQLLCMILQQVLPLTEPNVHNLHGQVCTSQLT